MIELEIYAANVRNPDNILALHHELEAIPGLRFKVDRNHDIVYLEADMAEFTMDEIRKAFLRIGLQPRVAGQIPPPLQDASKKKTQQLR